MRAPLRESDNCGGSIHAVPPEQDLRGSGCLKGVLLTDRWHLNLPEELIDGQFDLVDLETQQSVPFQVIELESGDPVPYAAQRAGLGSGTPRLGMFEQPSGIRRDLCFVARDVPAAGYKTFRLAPAPETGGHANQAPASVCRMRLSSLSRTSSTG